MGHVWLIGMMGSGKSTVGRLVADRLGRPFYDTDELIEQAGDASIPEIFAEEGESGFRERERWTVEDVASRPPGIVATGGGIILDPANIKTMRGVRDNRPSRGRRRDAEAQDRIQRRSPAAGGGHE